MTCCFQLFELILRYRISFKESLTVYKVFMPRNPTGKCDGLVSIVLLRTPARGQFLGSNEYDPGMIEGPLFESYLHTGS